MDGGTVQPLNGVRAEENSYMPKIMGTLADVSTTYQLIEPDTYEFKIDKVDVEETKPSAENANGQLAYIVTSRIDMPGTEHHNKPVKEYIYWYKKDGTVNPYSKIALKRYCEAVLGEERANEDDLDTDELIGGRFEAEVYIDTYEDKRSGEERQSNRIKNIVAL